MVWKLLLIFTLVPLLELWLLIEIGRIWGALPTILLVAATGIVGVILLKHQGSMVMHRIRQELSFGQLPTHFMLDGLFLLLAGALLLTPGALTDVLALAFLIPFSRQCFKGAAKKMLQRMVERGNVHFYHWNI